MTARRIPRATYRVQLTPSFTFEDAAALVPQLAELGVSHLYLSPILEAVPGSTHGYDVIDPGRIREAFGGLRGLRALADVAHGTGLGLISDLVPNHVGLVSPANPWWWDTLRHGPEGRYGRHLDIRWKPGAHGQPSVLVPELGEPWEIELASGALRLEHRTPEEAPDREGYRVVYHEHAWPIRPGSVAEAGLDEADVAGTVDAVASDPARLRDLLERQHHRLAHWRRANDELDHRRFFDVTTLGGVRIEVPEVFADAHAAILPLVADGTLDGLRIDHPDGLRDPVGYLERLRHAVGPDPWIVIEKVLERGEARRTGWPVDGTVGYEVADLILGLHVDPVAGPVLDDLQTELTGAPIDRAAMVDEAKREALTALFGAERRWVTDELLCAAPALDRDRAHDGLVELLVAWPVYRTYVRPEDGSVSEADVEVIRAAAQAARQARPDLADIVDVVTSLLLLEERSDAGDGFVRTFQQLTGPAIAKGLEDTVLYRDLRFVAVNEVGGHPAVLGRDVSELHDDSQVRQRDWPATMVLSSSHDTKRSHDVRARLAVLSHDPDGWADTVRQWRELAAPHRSDHGPSPAHEHLVFQTLVGAWPIDEQRLTDYLVKAAREGKEHTDWLDPDLGYEDALTAYARGLLADQAFVAELEGFVDAIREPGWLTSLSMQTVALTTPGVPDIYQGNEVWDLSLVDPDNRRPVDHAGVGRSLARLAPDDTDPADLLAHLDEGLPKLWVVRQALGVRKERPAAFGTGASYAPLTVAGARADHLAAFLRNAEVAVVVPLRVRGLGARHRDWAWGDTSLSLPEGRWHDVMGGVTHSGGERPVSELLGRFPVALLVRS